MSIQYIDLGIDEESGCPISETIFVDDRTAEQMLNAYLLGLPITLTFQEPLDATIAAAELVQRRAMLGWQ
jgi:hypothetical protein